MSKLVITYKHDTSLALQIHQLNFKSHPLPVVIFVSYLFNYSQNSFKYELLLFTKGSALIEPRVHTRYGLP